MLINTSTVINCAMRGMAGKQTQYHTDKFSPVLYNKSCYICAVHVFFLQSVPHVFL